MVYRVLWAPAHPEYRPPGRRSQRFTETQTAALNAAFAEYQVDGQLPRTVKRSLVEYTGLTLAQVNRWVENKHRSLIFTDRDIVLLNETLLHHGTDPPNEVVSHLMKKARKTEKQIREWLAMNHYFNVVESALAT